MVVRGICMYDRERRRVSFASMMGILSVGLLELLIIERSCMMIGNIRVGGSVRRCGLCCVNHPNLISDMHLSCLGVVTPHFQVMGCCNPLRLISVTISLLLISAISFL